MTSTSAGRRIVIAGAGAGGLAVAETARSQGFDGELVILGRERHIPYDRPPLSKQILSGAWEPERAFLRPRSHLDDLGIVVRVNERVVGLSGDEHEVILESGERVGYDNLAIATGVNSRHLPGAEHLEGVHVLRDLEHALALRNDLAAGRKLVVIGAGVLGSEVASAAAELQVSVTLVDTVPLPMARVVGSEVGELIRDMHLAHGVALKLEVGVAGFDDDHGRVVAVRLSDGSRIEADVVLVAIGSTPATEWIGDNGGVRTGGVAPQEGSGGILCSVNGLAAPDIYAAGDVAAWWNPKTERYDRIEHRLNAAEQGQVIARSILDATFVPPERVPYFWSDQYGSKLQSFGSFDPHDQFIVVTGSLTERKFVGIHVREDIVTAVMGMGLHREIRQWRGEIGKTIPAASLT